MDFQSLTDDDLEAMRQAPKIVANPNAQWVLKGAHREKNFILHDAFNAAEAYRIFLRISVRRDDVFSVGLARVWAADKVLILTRYNGGYHPHRNVLERTKVPAVCHRHIATQRYIQACLDPDGYAEAISGYNSVESAFRCLCIDSGVASLDYQPFQPELEF